MKVTETLSHSWALDGRRLKRAVCFFSRTFDINVKHLAGELVHVMHLKEFSNEALKTSEKWQHPWEDRLVINGDNEIA